MSHCNPSNVSSPVGRVRSFCVLPDILRAEIVSGGVKRREESFQSIFVFQPNLT